MAINIISNDWPQGGFIPWGPQGARSMWFKCHIVAKPTDSHNWSVIKNFAWWLESIVHDRIIHTSIGCGGQHIQYGFFVVYLVNGHDHDFCRWIHIVHPRTDVHYMVNVAALGMPWFCSCLQMPFSLPVLSMQQYLPNMVIHYCPPPFPKKKGRLWNALRLFVRPSVRPFVRPKLLDAGTQ